jgi:hypothetical protein
MGKEQAINVQRWLKMVEDQSADDAQVFGSLLGKAVIDQWGNMERSTQEQLFELAVAAGSMTSDERLLRERLAVFLHDHHPRTEKGNGETKKGASGPVDVAGQNGGLP